MVGAASGTTSRSTPSGSDVGDEVADEVAVEVTDGALVALGSPVGVGEAAVLEGGEVVGSPSSEESEEHAEPHVTTTRHTAARRARHGTRSP